MLNYEYPPLGGGAGNATRAMLDVFADRGNIAVDLVTSSTDHSRIEYRSPEIRLHVLDIGKDTRLHHQSIRDLLAYAWNARRYIKSLIRTHRYTCCHAFFGIPCGYLAMKTGLPYIVSLRGSDVPSYNPRFALADALMFRRLSPRIWRNAAAVVANSTGLRDLALQSAPHQEIRVIPNGVDTQSFTPAPELAAPTKLLCVARLVPRKGIDDILRALTHLPEAELTVIGTGSHKHALRARAQELGVAARVQWLGHVPHDQLPRHYQSAGLFVLPSRNEGMSNAALEALASGLPLLLTNTGGTSELLRDAHNGFVIRADRPEDIAARIRMYTHDRDLHRAHGRHSRAIAESMSWAAVADAYAALYERAAGSS